MRAIGVAALAVVASALVAGVAWGAAPGNDDFAHATALEGETASFEGSTVGATAESGEPAHGGEAGGSSVWFSWTAPRSRQASVELCAGGWGAVVAAYEGDALTDLVPVGSARSHGSGGCGVVRFRATAAVTYHLAVDGRTLAGEPETGPFSLRLTSSYPPPPANDDFANAGSFSEAGAAYGTTEGANREPGEPQHGADPVGASVWYRWTAATSGPMVLSACQADFHLALDVYTGSSLGTLTAVDRAGGSSEQWNQNLGVCALAGRGSVAFDARAGTTYSVAVDGEDGGFGRFLLELLTPHPAFVDTFPPQTYIRRVLRIRGHGAAVQFSASEGQVSFACKLDRGAFRPCVSPERYRHLSPGIHRVAVKATDAAGNEDRTPAVRTFHVRGKRR